jgi:Ni,Fe-hydrogenase maturation factor
VKCHRTVHKTVVFAVRLAEWADKFVLLTERLIQLLLSPNIHNLPASSIRNLNEQNTSSVIVGGVRIDIEEEVEQVVRQKVEEEIDDIIQDILEEKKEEISKIKNTSSAFGG